MRNAVHYYVVHGCGLTQLWCSIFSSRKGGHRVEKIGERCRQHFYDSNINIFWAALVTGSRRVRLIVKRQRTPTEFGLKRFL
jgi:hypothetical protein